MEIREGAVGAITVLDPVGKLVLGEGDSDTLLKDTMTRLMHEGRRQFMVNLAHISQVDTSGLTCLVAAQITVLKQGGQIKLLNPTQRLRELLGITKLNRFFEVFDSERDAIESFARESGAQT
jgi:anti-sigma B factor antagonist